MSSNWKSLKKSVEKLFDPEIDLQVHATAYRPERTMSEFSFARHWITLNGKIIWDFPKEFLEWKNPSKRDTVPYIDSSGAIADILRFYIDTPRNSVFTKQHPDDKWGLTDLLRAADRRIGKSRLFRWSENLALTSPARLVLFERFQSPYAPDRTLLDYIQTICVNKGELEDIFRIFQEEWQKMHLAGADTRPFHLAIGCSPNDALALQDERTELFHFLERYAPRCPSLAWKNVTRSLNSLLRGLDTRKNEMEIIKENLNAILQQTDCPSDLVDLPTLNDTGFYFRIKLVEPFLAKMIGKDSFQRLTDVLEALLNLAPAPTHEVLLNACHYSPKDFEPYGQQARTNFSDCSGGCRYFVNLRKPFQADWGVCVNPQSHRVGLLTFEHQGCPNFAEVPDTSPPNEDPETNQSEGD